jgi:hypothetical protein
LAIDKLEGKSEWKPEKFVKPIRPKSQKDYFYPDRDAVGVKHMAEIAEFLGDQIKGYYLAGTQDLWKNPVGILEAIDAQRDADNASHKERN